MAGDEKKEEPKKPLNRQKPFKRINNEKFIVAESPDGLGTDCGCHTREEYGEFDEEMDKFFNDHLPGLSTFRKIVDGALDIANEIMKFIPIPGLAQALKIAQVINEVAKKFFSVMGRRVLPRAARVIPQWVPVIKGASNEVVTADQVFEVEGIVTRSFGNSVEVPFRQWHRWLNWTVHLTPEPEYAKIKSPAPNPPNTEGRKTSEIPIAKGDAFEVQWDVGGLWFRVNEDNFQAFETGFKKDRIADLDGPMTHSDWAWPMAGSYVWASGRWVYDCSRTTHKKSGKPEMCAMLNPCKAIATARWKAAIFKENSSPVPAIQFMFYTSAVGGYIDYQKNNDQDYEFILDLPPGPAKSHPFPIQHTRKKVPHNTIVLRPRLLRRIRFLTNGPQIEPIIEPIQPEDGSIAPAQVRIKIPMTSFPNSRDAFGFVLSLGWHDPNAEQVAKLKTCKVELSHFNVIRKIKRDSGAAELFTEFDKEKKELIAFAAKKLAEMPIAPGVSLGSLPFIGPQIEKWAAQLIEFLVDSLIKLLPDTENEEWLFRIGINGEWRSFYFDSVSEKNSVSFPKSTSDSAAPPQPVSFQITLGEDDDLAISTHGVEIDPVGDIMRNKRFDRRITRFSGGEAPWPLIADISTPEKERRHMVVDYVFKVMTGEIPIGTDQAVMALGLENWPIGIFDPENPGNVPKVHNPIRMKGISDGKTDVKHQVLFARAHGPEAIYLEDTKTPDYDLFYSVTIQPAKES